MKTPSRRELGDSIWAPLADTMTLTSCVFLVVFLASAFAYIVAKQKSDQATAQLRALAAQRTQGVSSATAALAAVANSARDAGIDLDERNHVLRIADSALFDLNSAEVRPENKAFITQTLAPAIAKSLDTPGHTIIIGGHADSVPFKSDRFGNWSLSARRATAVLALILEARPDIKPGRVIAVGYGDTRPIEGIPPDAAKNRRVEIGSEADAKDLIMSLAQGGDYGTP